MAVLHLLGLKRLMARPLVVVLSIVGIAAGVGLVVSVNAVLTSVQRSIEELTAMDDRASLTVYARSPLGMDEDVLRIIEADPDVVTASPQLLRPYLVDGEETLLIGRADVARPMAGAFHADHNTVQLATPSRSVEIDITAAPSEHTSINDGRVLLLPLPDAQRLTDRLGTIDAVALVVTPGSEHELAARLEDAIGPMAHVGSADAQYEFALAQMEQVESPLLFMAMVALVAGGFLIFNTIDNSARQRERELAVLRAVGATRRQLGTGLLLEAVTLGLIGSTLGVALGGLLGRRIVNALPSLIDSIAGTTVRYHADPGSVPSALAAGVLVSALSAVVPIVRTVRVRPDQVLTRRPPPCIDARRRHRALPFAMAAATAGVVAVRSEVGLIAQLGLALILTAFLLGGFGLADHLARVTGKLAGWSSSLGQLAEADIGRSGSRVWATIAAVFVAVTIALAVGGAARNQGDTLRQQFDMSRQGDLWVTTTSSDDLPIDFYYPADSADEIRALPGVESVHATTLSYAVQDGRRFIVFASDGPVRLPQVSLAEPEAIQRMIDGPEAIVTHQFANSFDLAVGDQMRLDGRNGPLSLRVAAINRTTSVSKWGTVNIGRTTYVEAFGDPGLTGMEINTTDDADTELVKAQITEILGPSTPLVVVTGDEFFETVIASVDDSANVFLAVTTAIVFVAGLATLNAVAASVVERRRQLGVLRSIGATPRQIRRLVLTEVVAAGIVGSLLGLLCGNLLHRLVVDVTNRTTPFPEDYSFSWPTLTHALVSAAVAVIVGGAVPAWQSTRSRIAEALAYE